MFHLRKIGFDHNCGHILLRVISKSRPFQASDIAQSGKKDARAPDRY